jgi:hypothetical protein
MEAKQESARDLLNDAARVRDLETAVTLELLQKDRELGKLDARTTQWQNLLQPKGSEIFPQQLPK